jgi:hypothetical protein
MVGYAPSADQILDLDGVVRRADDFRFELIDQGHSVIGDLHPDMGRTPQITNDTSSAVPRTMSSFYLTSAEVTDINPLTDQVRPVMILQNAAEYVLGVFRWASDSEPVRAWGSERASTLSDKMVLLNQGTSTSLGWGKGADIGLIVAGIALGVFPDDQVNLNAIDAELGVGVTHPLGAAQRQILAELLKVVSFLPPWINRDGSLQIVPTPDMDSVEPTLVYEAGGRIIDGTIARSNDQLDAPNVFRAYENSGQAQLIGEYRIPASAPHSVENRGYEICDPQPVSGLKTQAQADAAAKSLSVTQNTTYRWLSFDSTLDPRHDTWDPVTALGTTWIETKWTMSLRSGGAMNHLLRQVF